MSKKLLEGRVGIITGATSGIGQAAAHLFAAEGAKIVLAGRRKDKGEAIAESVRAEGGEAYFCQCDVSSEEQVKHLVAFTIEKFGRLDWAFNNAGVAATQYELNLVADTHTELCREIFDINVMGLYYSMKYEIPEMLKAGGGSIVNTLSNIAVGVVPGSFAYAVSKAAGLGATRSAAIDYAGQNIRVNAIAPGMTDTPMMDKYKTSDPEGYDAIKYEIPDHRDSTALEQANTALYLLSDLSTHIIGQMIVVDGGQTIKM